MFLAIPVFISQVKCHLSSLAKRESEGRLFKQVSVSASLELDRSLEECTEKKSHSLITCTLTSGVSVLQLLDTLKFYTGFEINDVTG